MDIFGLLVAGLVIIFCTWYFNFYRNYVRHMNKFSGPPTNILLGNALDFQENTEVIHVFHKYSKKYGSIVKVRVGIEYMLLITDYKFLEFLLSGTKIMDKSRVYTFLSRWLGTGLLTAGAEKWKKQRRIIAPAFHVQVLEKFVEVFNNQADKLVDKLTEEVDKDSFDVFPYVTLSALDIICETAMGVPLNAVDNSDSDYVKSVQTMCTIILERAHSAVMLYDPIYKLTSRYREEKRALKILHNVTNSVIKKKEKELQSSRSEEDNERNRKKAFLDLLLQYRAEGHLMSSEELREEVDTFMFAGHDTTAAATSFALYSLAQYPDIQESVLEEQKHIFENDIMRSVTQQDLIQMKYLENVIKETLRLYPSVPFYVRQTAEDIVYEGRVIPKDVSLMIYAYGMHRKEEFFPDPEKFDPTRFESSSNKLPYAYIPFSAGPRNCIGQKFAMMEMKTLISKIVRNYELLPAIPEHKIKISGETVLRAVNGHIIRLKKRHH